MRVELHDDLLDNPFTRRSLRHARHERGRILSGGATRNDRAIQGVLDRPESAR
jgi:hypothetical protein